MVNFVLFPSSSSSSSWSLLPSSLRFLFAILFFTYVMYWGRDVVDVVVFYFMRFFFVRSTMVWWAFSSTLRLLDLRAHMMNFKLCCVCVYVCTRNSIFRCESKICAVRIVQLCSTSYWKSSFTFTCKRTAHWSEISNWSWGRLNFRTCISAENQKVTRLTR